MMIFSSDSREETEIFASMLARILLQTEDTVCLALNGTLGVGKTCFTKGLARGLGIHEEIVSPSFAILQDYEGEKSLLHSDFYRLEPTDLQNLGLEEQLEDFEGIVVVEWAEKFPELLPLDHLALQIALEGDTRIWTLKVHGEQKFLHSIAAAWRSALEERE